MNPWLLLPRWIDRRAYPFEPRRLETPLGVMHYVDEGRGLPILMLHGNPTWSFEYRHLIAGLSDSFRCIAVDHLGFGLSEKPFEIDYTPALLARNVERLVEELGLDEVVLMGGDWGGPLGLSLAAKSPGLVRAVLLFNTWAWPASPLDLYYQTFSRVMGGAAGRYLIRRHNFFVEHVLPAAVGRKRVLTPGVMDHYRRPFEFEADRKASWSLPGQIVGAHDWLAQLWARRDRYRHLPFLVLWGERDPAFRQRELARWRRELTRAEVHVFGDVGHSFPEEAPVEALPLIRRFLAAHVSQTRHAVPGAGRERPRRVLPAPLRPRIA